MMDLLRVLNVYLGRTIDIQDHVGDDGVRSLWSQDNETDDVIASICGDRHRE